MASTLLDEGMGHIARLAQERSKDILTKGPRKMAPSEEEFKAVKRQTKKVNLKLLSQRTLSG